MISGVSEKMGNLKPWKPGVSGNPRGRPRGLGQDIRLMPRKEFLGIIDLLFWSPFNVVARIARSRSRPTLQVLIARALLHDSKHGSMDNLDRILNRVIGKPKQIIEYRLTCRRCGGSANMDGPLKTGDL